MQKITPPTFLNQISSNVGFLELYDHFEKVDFSHFSHGKFLFPFKANTSRGAPLRHSKFQLNPFVVFFFFFFWRISLWLFGWVCADQKNRVMSQGLPRRAPLKKGTVTWGGSLGQKRRFSVKFECKLLHSWRRWIFFSFQQKSIFLILKNQFFKWKFPALDTKCRRKFLY